MKLNSTIVVLASLTGSVYASDHLRSRNDIAHVEEKETKKTFEAFVYMKQSPDRSRLLHRSHETMTSEEKKRQATLEKHEKMDALQDEVMMTVPGAPYSELTLKETNGYIDDFIPDNNGTSSDFGINIVGGEVSDENEFPYYGTLCRPSSETRCTQVVNTNILLPYFHS